MKTRRITEFDYATVWRPGNAIWHRHVYGPVAVYLEPDKAVVEARVHNIVDSVATVVALSGEDK